MARVHLHKPRLSRPLLWAGLCVAAAAVTVQITRTGVDVLALMLAGFILLLLERTIGDWIAESLGPAATAFVFAVIAALGVWYVMSTGGRAKVQRLFAIAEARGYHTMYVTLDGDTGTEGNETKAISDAMRDAGDAVTPRSADPRAISPQPRTTSATPPPSRAVNPSGRGGIGGGGVPSVRGPEVGAPGADPGTADGAQARTSVAEDVGDGGPLRIVRLILNPEIVMTGDRVTFRAMVNGRIDPTAVIEFSIDGHTVSTASVGSDGIAKSTFSIRAPGQYTVRARVVDGPLRITEVSALLSVLPGRR